MTPAIKVYAAVAAMLLLAIGAQGAGMLRPDIPSVSAVRQEAAPPRPGEEPDRRQPQAEMNQGDMSQAEENRTEENRAEADQAAAILARPMFNEGRRPAAQPGTTVAASADRPRLFGIITGPFPGCAILLVPGSPKQITLQEGGRVNNLVVKSITPEHVIIEVDGATQRLVVMQPGAGKPAARI